MKPYNLESEQLILGSILHDPSCLKQLKLDLQPDDLGLEKHRYLLEVIYDLADSGITPELSVVYEAIKKNGNLALLDKDYLMQLTDSSCGIAALDFHVQAVKEHNSFFRLAELSDLIKERIQAKASPEEITSEAQDVLQSLRLPAKKTGNITSDVTLFVEAATGIFYSSDIVMALNIRDRKAKKSVSMALSRLCEEEIIERQGSRNGCFRKIEKDSEVIDWKTFEGQDLDFRFPLGLHRWIKIYPKSLFVFAGAPDSGKSAFAFNLIFLNQGRFKTHYFTSEMGPQELKSRLEKFDEIGVDDWKFIAKERAADFADVIQPDDLNIIDFLEITDNFYLIARQLAEIYAKLKTGIAVVFIQKAPGATLGRGASFSLEKPRLYCTLDKHTLKIIKAKNWRDSDKNPNNQAVKYKIVAGCKIFQDTDWSLDI